MTEITRLSDLLPAAAARVPDRIAVETAVGAAALTYRALYDTVWQGATGLRARGLEPGARVGIAMDGSPGWAVAFFSVIQAGLVAVPVPAAIPSDLLALVMHHVEARCACATKGT
jgi:long-chain acyl-CoA synthetase